MKNKYLSFFLLLGMVGCSWTKNETLNLKQGQSKTIYLVHGESVTLNEGQILTLLRTEDSRCPKATTCVWEGFASGFFQFNAAGSVYAFQLNTVAQGNTKTEYEAGGYRFTIKDVTPYPVVNTQPTSRTVLLQVALL